jgi:cation transport ATPase
VSTTERSLHFFCSRECRERFLRSEDQHRQRLHTEAGRVVATDKPRPLVTAPVRSASLEPVARRVAPTKASTPLWPLIGAVLCAGTTYLPVVGAQQAGAFALLGLSIVFASRTPRTRSEGGLLTWLAGPVAVGLLGLSAWLGPGGVAGGRSALLAGSLGVALTWLREHLLERASAARHAQHTELSARLSRRVRVSSPPTSARAHESTLPLFPQGTEGALRRAATGTTHIARSEAGTRTSERAVEGLREGDEVWCEAGSVIPVDGVVSDGAAEVLPYPRARTAIERGRGSAVLAGALVVSGLLRVVAQRVGDRRALFGVLHETSEPDEQADQAVGALAIAGHARGLQGALSALAALLLVALVAPHVATAKLAGVAAALLALPALALARGVRNVFRMAVLGAAARGVRFRDATIIERAGRTDTAVLRVEGVVVPRVYTLVQTVSLSEGFDANALLALALAAGSASEESQAGVARDERPHAIARAVREHAEPLAVEPAVLRRITHTRGLGVNALTDGQGPLVFGSRQALLSAGVSVAAADREAQRAESNGQRVVFLALGGRVRGLLVFTQAVRSEARPAVQTLFDLGLEVELVSGDHRATVESIARTLDITQLKAELSAEQRAAEVSRLCDGEAQVVAFGAAPADEAMLTSAGLSLCLDAAAQPHHHEPGQPVSYDITTATDDLRDAVAALVLARKARRALRRVYAAAALGSLAGLLAAAAIAPPLVVVLLAAGVDLLCLSSAPGLGGRRWSAARRRAEDAA